MAKLEELLATERQQADLAIQEGRDPIEVNSMYNDATKQIKIDNGVDPFKANWDYEGDQMKLAVQAGKDPKEVQEMYNQATTHLTVEQMLKPTENGFDKLGNKIVAGVSGVAHGVSQIAGNAEVLLGRLAKSIGLDFGEDLAKSGREYLAENEAKFNADPFVNQNQKSAGAGSALGNVAATSALIPVGMSEAAGVGGTGLLAASKYVGKQVAANAASGALSAGEGGYGTGAAIGGVLGLAGGLVGASAKGVENMAQKSLTPEMMANQQKFTKLGIEPTYAQVSNNPSVKAWAGGIGDLPGTGGFNGKTAIANLQEGVETAISKVDPGKAISFIDKLDPEGKITTVNGLDLGLQKRIFASPGVAGKEMPVADDQLVSELKSIASYFGQNKTKNAPTKIIRELVDTAKQKMTLEGLHMARQGFDDAARMADNSAGLSVSEKQASKAVANIIRSRLDRMAGELKVGKEWQAYNAWYHQKADFTKVQTAFEQSFNPRNYNQFDADKAYAEFNKLLTNKKMKVQTEEAKNVARGLKKILPMFKTQAAQLKGTNKKQINQVAGASALGMVSGLAGFTNQFASAKVVTGVATYLTGVRFLNKLLNSPRGLKMLQEIGSKPGGVSAARKLSERLARTAAVVAPEEMNDQGQQYGQ